MEVNCTYPKMLEYFNNDLAPVGLLAQLVERCTGIAEVKGVNPVQASISFFRLSFRNCKSCVYNCDDHLFFTPQFTYMIFIYS